MHQAEAAKISTTAPGSSVASAQASEKNARSPKGNSASAYNKRSCVVCRARKVRCDKLSPCSNCRRANIDCILPCTDRPPRWARRLDRVAGNVASQPLNSPNSEPAAAQVMERIRNLESLVKELNEQLKQANAAGSSGVNCPESLNPEPDAGHQSNIERRPRTGNTQDHFGRLVPLNGNQNRYVSSGFWSRISERYAG